MQRLIVTYSCPDSSGIVHAVTEVVMDSGGNIVELQQFSSPDSGRFFMRLECDVDDSCDFRHRISTVATRFQARCDITEAERPMRTLIMASKIPGPLSDLLFHMRSGEVNIDVPLVMANHPDLAKIADFYEVPFEHHHVDKETKPAFEQRMRQVIDHYDIDLVVLARYMQIVSADLCDDLPGRIINIHHSFLPGFKGANPYRQAHERGVKLIGATAHYVTADLDEGPIIEQNVHRISHVTSVQEMRRIGQRLESTTLTEAVKLHAEKRVFLDGVRTVILN